MKNIPYPKFTFYYMLLCIVVIAADFYDLKWTFYLSKPLVLASLFIFYIIQTGNISNKIFRNFMLAGFLFSLGGDTLLMFTGKTYFIYGLLSFLIAHLCYAAAFVIEMYQNRPWKQHWSQLAFSTLLVVFGAEFYILNRYSFGDLSVPIMIYCIAITLMGVAAVMRDKTVNHTGYFMVVTGAVLFVISDSLLATNMFVMQIPFSEALVKGSYFIAQYLIGMGTLADLLKQIESKTDHYAAHMIGTNENMPKT